MPIITLFFPFSKEKQGNDEKKEQSYYFLS